MEKLTEDIKKHFSHYLVLLVILNFGVGFFYLFKSDPGLRTLVVLTVGAAYVFWGIIHHWLEGDLHLKVAVEYFLVALAAVVVLLSLLLRL